MPRPVLLSVAAAMLLAVPRAPASASAPSGLECRATGEGVAALLVARAARVVGLPVEPGLALRWRAHRSLLQVIQSDRTYPPFFSSFSSLEAWLDPATGAERTMGLGGAYPGAEIPGGRFPGLATANAEWIGRDSTWIAPGDRSGSVTLRPLNPWAVLGDYARAGDVRVVGRCLFRDYPRVALEREGPLGVETLLLDPKTWVPVALIREEPHFLWGQARAEYVWSNWDATEGRHGLFPRTAFRTVVLEAGVDEPAEPPNAEVEVSLTVTHAAVLPIDSAPPLAVPDTALRLLATSGAFWRPERPDTVRFAPRGMLLVNRFYTTGAVLARDTVFLLDATLSEARARQDSAWIARTFPGSHPIVLVVTDLAWPHIGGVRFWVANGATVVAHRAAGEFLRRVVERRWTREPDRLERGRGTARFRFRPVDDSLVLGGGAVRLHAIDGVASEVALLAWLPELRFLWPGDYIQSNRQPTQYAREVLRAVRRVGVTPERFAAQHVALTPWRVIDSLHPDEPPTAVHPSDVNASSLRVGRLVRAASITRDGTRQERGEQAQVLSRIRYGGRDAIVSVQEFATRAGPAVDSSIADAVTLAPIRHVGVHRSRTMVIDFDGARITGRYAPERGAPLPVEQTLAARPYDASLYDVVIASLPLAVGYRARLPFYVYEQGGLVWYDVVVTGTDTLRLRDGSTASVWHVETTEDGELRSRLWIGRSGPREVLRSTAYFGGAEATNTR